MVDVTIFEFHLPGASFNAPFAGAGDAAGSEETTEDGGADPRARESGGALAAVGVLLGVALLAWYLRRSREDADPEASGGTGAS